MQRFDAHTSSGGTHRVIRSIEEEEGVFHEETAPAVGIEVRVLVDKRIAHFREYFTFNDGSAISRVVPVRINQFISLCNQPIDLFHRGGDMARSRARVEPFSFSLNRSDGI